MFITTAVSPPLARSRLNTEPHMAVHLPWNEQVGLGSYYESIFLISRLSSGMDVTLAAEVYVVCHPPFTRERLDP